MKLSELIEQLEEKLDEYGDLEARSADPYGFPMDISSAEYSTRGDYIMIW